jgi:hypothetical protein
VDVDIPTPIEGEFFTTPARKVLFLLGQSLFYGVRPGIVSPKSLNGLDKLNYAVVIFTDVLVLYFFGLGSLMYLISSVLLGMGLHPVAGNISPVLSYILLIFFIFFQVISSLNITSSQKATKLIPITAQSI